MHKQQQMIRYLCQTKLAPFARMAFGWMNPQAIYQHRWYIDVLADKLERCLNGEISRLMINMPPRYLKSFITSIAFPVWALARKPDAKFMCITGNTGLLQDQLIATRSLINHRQYQSVFPHIKFRDMGNTIRTARNGYRAAYQLTPGSGLTGRGADVVIIDDPISASKVFDDKSRQNVNDWFDQNIYQRLNDKSKGCVILVMQRLHKDDLAGHLISQGGWDVLTLPAIAMQDETYPPLFGDRVLRSKGEALHPGLETRVQLRSLLLSIGAIPFKSQYQQDPLPPDATEYEGGTFTFVTKDNPNPTYEEMKWLKWGLLNMPRSHLLLKEIFGEFVGVVRGSYRMQTEEEWAEWVRVTNGYPEDMVMIEEVSEDWV